MRRQSSRRELVANSIYTADADETQLEQTVDVYWALDDLEPTMR